LFEVHKVIDGFRLTIDDLFRRLQIDNRQLSIVNL
jgi:hypothetical protein